MSHHKRYSSGRRTAQSHNQAWLDAQATIADIMGQAEEPRHYAEVQSAMLSDLGSGSFVGASRRGINMQGYISLQDFYESTWLEIIARCEKWCNEATAYMKQNHPWKNRTHRAENGLGAVVAGMEGEDISMYLFHSVWYGIRLEGQDPSFRYPSGNVYPIIEPTRTRLGPALLNSLQGILER